MDTQQPALITVLAALIAPTLATVVGIALANRNAARAVSVAAKTAESVKTRQEAISDQLGAIHGLVNGRLESAQETIQRLEAELYAATGGASGKPHQSDESE